MQTGSIRNKNSSPHINLAIRSIESRGTRCLSAQMANGLLEVRPTLPRTKFTFGTSQTTVSLRAPWTAAGNLLSTFMYVNPLVRTRTTNKYLYSGTRASHRSSRLRTMATSSSGTARRRNAGVHLQVVSRRSTKTWSTENVRMNLIL